MDLKIKRLVKLFEAKEKKMFNYNYKYMRFKFMLIHISIRIFACREGETVFQGR
jgi:hypothetical protein